MGANKRCSFPNEQAMQKSDLLVNFTLLQLLATIFITGKAGCPKA